MCSVQVLHFENLEATTSFDSVQNTGPSPHLVQLADGTLQIALTRLNFSTQVLTREAKETNDQPKPPCYEAMKWV